MKKEINCIKCGREINLKEDYIKLIEFIKGKENRTQYFHKSCYEEIFNIKKMALNMVSKVNQLMSMAGVKDEKIMEVKA